MRLVTDLKTSKGKEPSWMLMVERDGIVAPLMVNGQPMRWQPDWNTSSSVVAIVLRFFPTKVIGVIQMR